MSAHLFKMIDSQFKCFPSDYLAVDIETSGFRIYRQPGKPPDVITQIGHCLVMDRIEQDRDSFILDWVRYPGVDQEWLKKRLLNVQKAIEDRGESYHVTYERMADEGISPVPTLQIYYDWFDQMRKDRTLLVTQNGLHFDCDRIERHFARFLKKKFSFKYCRVLDIGLLEKASQMQLPPWPCETLRDYCLRLSAQQGKDVKWNLRHCVSKYDLDTKFGVDLMRIHDASYDCWVYHLLLETMRSISLTV